jgi:ribosomal protein S18 acetylase RimI-like enzyme
MTAIIYSDSCANIAAEQMLGGFFEGWPHPPSADAHLRILQGSYAVVLAVDDVSEQVVGFITAISDGVSSAYIPHLEVLPAYRKQGIGEELVRRMLARLSHLYMVDLVCDPDVQPFYARFGMRPYSAMIQRNYDRQACD